MEIVEYILRAASFFVICRLIRKAIQPNTVTNLKENEWIESLTSIGIWKSLKTEYTTDDGILKMVKFFANQSCVVYINNKDDSKYYAVGNNGKIYEIDPENWFILLGNHQLN